MLTDFVRFILIFNKMALIFLGLLIVFTVSSFEFQQVNHCLDFANNGWAKLTQPQSTGLSGLGAMLESLTQAATEAKPSSRVSQSRLRHCQLEGQEREGLNRVLF